jgi:hypothetical protein
VNDETTTQADSKALDKRSSDTWAAVIMLTIVTLLTFANAAHDSLVFDDKVFVASGQKSQLENLTDAFRQDLWNISRQGKGLYRPFLLINFELETRLFGDWLPGYHIVNILLHLAASLSLFGFLRFLLSRARPGARLAGLSALLAALVFAVHPVHTEVVNSVFNRSSIYVTLCAVLGLWWLLSRLDTRPASAWLGLGIFYTIGIFYKESALVIPGIAVALIVILTPGSAMERIKRFLPVFWLLVPLAVYFYLRAMALASGTQVETELTEFEQMMRATRLPDQALLLAVFGVLGAGIKLLLWPWPLHLYPSRPEDFWAIVLILGQAIIAVTAFVLWLRNRPGLAAGLAFYYIAMAPSARLISMDGALPHLAERYLYYPSVGLSIALASLFAVLLTRFGAKAVTAVSMPVIVLLAALCWDRNYDWGSQLVLFETDYQRGNRSTRNIRILVSALGAREHWIRITEICEENMEVQLEEGIFANTCGNAYLKLNRVDEAFSAFERGTEDETVWIQSRRAIAEIYFGQGKKQEGADQYAIIVNTLEDPAEKEFYKGLLLVKLYPGNRSKLHEAIRHFELALSINQELKKAQAWKDYIGSLLEPDSSNEGLDRPEGT